MFPSFVGTPGMSTPSVPRQRPANTNNHERFIRARASLSAGDVVRGKVARLAKFGAFVELSGGVQGLVHISEIANGFVHDVSEFVNPGDEVDVRILAIEKPGRYSLSIKQCQKALSGYERMLQLGGDFGDAWNSDGKTVWTDLGDRPDASPEFWESDPSNFRPFAGAESEPPIKVDKTMEEVQRKADI